MSPVLFSLCEVCAHRREIISGKGSRFLLCTLARAQPAMAKYPPQPVLRCGGFEPRTTVSPERPTS